MTDVPPLVLPIEPKDDWEVARYITNQKSKVTSHGSQITRLAAMIRAAAGETLNAR
jgi:hypothetical protein